MSKQIPLTQGKVAIVDDADYEWLTQWKWHYLNSGYAGRSERIKGGKIYILMHRSIMNAPAAQSVDHVNHDKLDNQRLNLRLATDSQQLMNTRKQRRSTSSVFKGVSLKCNRWEARIKVADKYISLGRYLTQNEAAQAYNEAAIRYFGEFAEINDLTLLSPSDETPLSEHIPTSPYKGVYFHRNRWKAYIDVERKRIWLGGFLVEDAAARAYDAYVKEHNLNRPLNFPDPTS